jgi:hypothetical protein
MVSARPATDRGLGEKNDWEPATGNGRTRNARAGLESRPCANAVRHDCNHKAVDSIGGHQEQDLPSIKNLADLPAPQLADAGNSS